MRSELEIIQFQQQIDQRGSIGLAELEDIEDIPEKEPEEVVPLEVKVINPEVKVKNWYDSVDDDEYDYLGVTKEDLDEFEKDGDSPGK